MIKNNRKALRGFSLMEVLVGSALLAMMSFLLFNSINSSIKAKDFIDNASRQRQYVRQALTRMTKEISMAYLSKHINKSNAPYVTKFLGSKDRLFFTAFGNVVMNKDAKISDQQILGYFISQDKKGRQSLFRQHNNNLMMDIEHSGMKEVLCPNVESVEFAYFDNRNETWEDRWISDPSGLVQMDTKQDDKSKENLKEPKLWRLPSFVKVTIVSKDEDGKEIKMFAETKIFIDHPLDIN